MLQEFNQSKETHKNHINSLYKNKEFMSNVGYLAELQVLQPKTKELIKTYNHNIKAQKGRIVMKAIAQSITKNNGKYSEGYAIKFVEQELLVERHNNQMNDREKVKNLFATFANRDKDVLQKELDKLAQQEETKADPVVPKSILDQLFGRPQALKKILALPEVKEKYDECVGLLLEDKRQNFDSMILRKCQDGITKDTVLAEIQKLKERMDKIQENQKKAKEGEKSQVESHVDNSEGNLMSEETPTQTLPSLPHAKSMTDLNSQTALNTASNTNITHKTGIVSALTQAVEYFRNCCSTQSVDTRHEIRTAMSQNTLQRLAFPGVSSISSIKSARFNSNDVDIFGKSIKHAVGLPPQLKDDVFRQITNLKSYSIVQDATKIQPTLIPSASNSSARSISK